MAGFRVFVGGLPYGIRKRDVFRFFRGYGRIKEVTIKNGYGFVQFDHQCDADDAVYGLNGKKLLGERVTVELARGIPRGRDQWLIRNDRSGGNDRGGNDRYGPPTRTNYRVIVENLSSRVNWLDLQNFMKQAGEVIYADAHKHHHNEGLVEFASLSDVKNAIEKLDDTKLNGRRVKITEDKYGYNKPSSSDSRSRSRSYRSRSRSYRSRSGSHSRSRSPARKAKSHSQSRGSSKKRSKFRDSFSERSRDVSRGRSRSRKPSRDKFRSREALKERSRFRTPRSNRSNSSN